jgi:hypothetical protein
MNPYVISLYTLRVRLTAHHRLKIQIQVLYHKAMPGQPLPLKNVLQVFPSIEPSWNAKHRTVNQHSSDCVDDGWLIRPIHEEHQQALSGRRQARHVAYCKYWTGAPTAWRNCTTYDMRQALKAGGFRRGSRVAFTIRIITAVDFRITPTEANPSHQCDVYRGFSRK